MNNLGIADVRSFWRLTYTKQKFLHDLAIKVNQI